LPVHSRRRVQAFFHSQLGIRPMSCSEHRRVADTAARKKSETWACELGARSCLNDRDYRDRPRLPAMGTTLTPTVFVAAGGP